MIMRIEPIFPDDMTQEERNKFDALFWAAIENTNNLVEAVNVCDNMFMKWHVTIKELPNGMPEITVTRRTIN